MGYKDISTKKDEKIIDAVKSSFSIRQTLMTLGLHPSGANYKGIRKHIDRLNLSTEHFLGQGHLKNKTHDWSPKIPLEKILVENSTYLGTTRLKIRLLKANLLTYKCYECGISTWRDKKLSLQLEHKNGNNMDHRIENLCLLCPNCHSQTPTFAGKNKGNY